MKPLCLYLQMVLLPNEIWKLGWNLLVAIKLAVKELNCTCLPQYCSFKPSLWCLSPFRLPLVSMSTFQGHIRCRNFSLKGWFPLSSNFDVRMCITFNFANKRGNVLKIAHKSKSWKLLKFMFKQNTSSLVSILFMRVKFTCMCMHIKIMQQWKSTLTGPQ